MKRLSLRARRDMERVAELRAGGAGWKVAAKAIGCDERVIRRWLVDYPDDWQRAYQNAERLVKADAGSESLRMLRDLLRDKSAKVRLGAADKLANILLKMQDGEPENEPRSELVAMAELVEEMSDEELEECLRYFSEESGGTKQAARETADDLQTGGAGMAGAAGAGQSG